MSTITTHIADRAITRLLSDSNQRSASRTKSYLIFSTPRVGSNLLCKGLEITEILGQPSEWFNKRIVTEIDARLKRKKFILPNYIETIISKSTSANGVFGVKVHIDQYIFWRKRNFDILQLGFDKIYYVERKDKIAQAYSLSKALLTDTWSKEEEKHNSKKLHRIKPSHVAYRLAEICRNIEYFDKYLSKFVYRRFDYDSLISDMASSAIHEIINDLGLFLTKDSSVKSDQKRQSDKEQVKRIESLKKYFEGK